MHGKRPHLRDERGFTMLELLVALVILGILATIALPAFLGQRQKGQDTEAKAMVRNAVVALRTYETDHETFAATRADLEGIEPAIANASPDFDVIGTADTFVIVETSDSGTEFVIGRDAAGRVTRDCSRPGEGLCRPALDGNGNRW
jgi:prepilin-type N-terminal cleavage/methylation domain-containing protein